MAHTLRVAAVQMDATPAPITDRLSRAEDLIAEAVSGGAQLLVLPEVFNTGYEYHDRNYGLAETLDGETVTWMKETARNHGIHLAGTLLLKDGADVYNSALLVAPEGTVWRYDKTYPWGWERAYFREGQTGTTVADTSLGKIGMMICWDYVHPDLWQQYAGKVDMMLVPSSPPRVPEFVIKVGDVELQMPQELVYVGEDEPFGTDLDAQAGWLGVPTVVTTASGRFSSGVPNERLSMLAGAMLNPAMRQHAGKGAVRIEAGYYNQTKVIDATGKVIARVSGNDEGYTVADVTIGDRPPQPRGTQPAIPIPEAAYVFSDRILPAISRGAYRKGYGIIEPSRSIPRVLPIIGGLVGVLLVVRLLRRR